MKQSIRRAKSICFVNNETKANCPVKSLECPKINEDFEGYIYFKVKNNLSLTASELNDAVFELNELDKEIDDNRRWDRSVNSYLACKDKIICISWEEGLTECQKNEFFSQPYFVKKHTYQKTITVTEYITEDAQENTQENTQKNSSLLPCPMPLDEREQIDLD